LEQLLSEKERIDKEIELAGKYLPTRYLLELQWVKLNQKIESSKNKISKSDSLAFKSKN